MAWKYTKLRFKFILNAENVCALLTNKTEVGTIEYTNFPAKYMNPHSKIHWNIHQVSVVSVTWHNRWGICIPELHNHAERHSASIQEQDKNLSDTKQQLSGRPQTKEQTHCPKRGGHKTYGNIIQSRQSTKQCTRRPPRKNIPIRDANNYD